MAAAAAGPAAADAVAGNIVHDAIGRRPLRLSVASSSKPDEDDLEHIAKRGPLVTPNAPDLDAIALRAADAWIDFWADTLAREGRAMAGGWPGTMSEARSRALAELRLDGAELATDRLEALARATYAAARAKWRSRAAAEDDE